MSEKKRIEWIDIAKGICMISVILGHLGVSELGFVFSYHLPVFFVLAGYTLRKSPITNAYLKSKFVSLLGPYFITCFAVTVMEAINLIFWDHGVSTEQVTKLLYTNTLRSFFASGAHQAIGSIEIGRFIGAIWFLPAMFFALVFTQLVLQKLQSKKLQTACAIIVAVIGCVSKEAIWLPFSIQAGMLAVPFVLAGVYLKEYAILERLKLGHYIVMLAVFAAGCISGYAQAFYMVSGNMKDWLITPLCAICSSLLIIGISRKINHASLLQFAGRNSAIFLCVHLFEMNTLSRYYLLLQQYVPALNNTFGVCLLKFPIIFLVSWIIVRIKNRRAEKGHETLSLQKRDYSLDCMRMLMIVLMIIGHVNLDYGLRKLIYSVHMVAFVMISGYFHRSSSSLFDGMVKALKTLMPYGVYAVLYIIVRHNGIFVELKNLLLGMSYSNKLFTEAFSVGPVWFILMLFVTKVLYAFIDTLRDEKQKFCVVATVFSLGILLGKCGIWLPWSGDCAMFALLFYYIAHCIRKYDILEYLKTMPHIYFVLSCIWAMMVYSGSMDIATRNYGNIGLTIIGALSAFALVYLMCDRITANMPLWLKKAISMVGQSTGGILIIHTLFGGSLTSFANDILGLNTGNIFNLCATILLHIMIAVTIQLGLGIVRKQMKMCMAKAKS